MTFDEMIDEAKRVGATLVLSKRGTLYSIDPPETLFGFSYHSHCIPPFKPEHTLILGYGAGQVASLMRMIWGGNVKITAVDNEKYDHRFIEFKMHVMDGWKFMKDCTTGIFKKKFDYICVDMWNHDQVPEIIFTAEFAVRLREMCARMVSINVPKADMFRLKKMIEDYGGLTFERGDLVGNNVVMWWSLPPDKK